MGVFPFTVVVPVYNRAHMLRECLAPLMDSSCTGLQVIVVDDGSTDDSAAVAAHLAAESAGANIHVVRQENGGPGAARNTGAARVTTEWIAFLDSDDCWFHGTAQILAETIARSGDASIIFMKTHDASDMPEGRNVSGARPEVRWHDNLLSFVRTPGRVNMSTANVLIRSDVFVEIGQFATDMFYAEDVHLFWRLPRNARVLEIIGPDLVFYRQHSGERLTNLSFNVVRDTAKITRGIGMGPIGRADPEKATVIAERLMALARRCFAQGNVLVPIALLMDGYPLLRRRFSDTYILKAMATPLLAHIRPENYKFGIEATAA